MGCDPVAVASARQQVTADPPQEFPPLQDGVVAVAAGARLVVLENLYASGSPDGRDLVETLPGWR